MIQWMVGVCEKRQDTCSSLLEQSRQDIMCSFPTVSKTSLSRVYIIYLKRPLVDEPFHILMRDLDMKSLYKWIYMWLASIRCKNDILCMSKFLSRVGWGYMYLSFWHGERVKELDTFTVRVFFHDLFWRLICLFCLRWGKKWIWDRPTDSHRHTYKFLSSPEPGSTFRCPDTDWSYIYELVQNSYRKELFIHVDNFCIK